MTSNSFAPNRIDTLIGASTRIDGDIACTGVLRVQGEVAGDVLCHEGPTGGLIVDSAGSVAGATNAPHIVVRGRVAGPAHSSQTIEIHQGASLVGDVSFKQMAIHAGGVVEGALNPTLDGNAPAEQAPSPATAAADAPSSGKRKVVIAATMAAVAIAVVWAGGWFPAAAPPAPDAEPAAVAPVSEPEPPAPASRAQPRQEAAAVEPAAAAAGSDSPVAVPAAEQQAQHKETVTVNGANPSRPTGVFLLIAHEPVVLYRKRPDDAGAGTRLSAEAGEKVSISVDAGELIRVAKGSALDIYYQGQKVPRNIVERGVWISFVPKPKPGKPGA